MPVNLTDRKLRSLKPAHKGKRYELHDAVIRGLRVRVSDQGSRMFVFRTRYPGSANPTRRTLGEYPSMTLEAAREKAAEWRKLIKSGVDPAAREADRRRAEARKRANTFAAVAEDFIAEKLPTERRGDDVEREIRRDLIPALGDRPVTEITRTDVRDLIQHKAKTAPTQARNLLATAKRMFVWAIDQERYGLETSPAASIKPKPLVGKPKTRERILNDHEVFALWRAVTRTPYPYGPLYRLLILTALRLNEVADAVWPEFDAPKALWTIPAERMKGRAEDAREHGVPLTADIAEVLNGLPRFKTGACLFSTTLGKKPVHVNDKVKKRIDARMLRTLRALARRRGEDPAKVTLPHWTNHDIRRTVRSNLSALRVRVEVAEAVLAHVLPGIIGVYDRHTYLDEKRDALERWAARLHEIVSPVPANVVRLRSA